MSIGRRLFQKVQHPAPIQLFGTDISDVALERARKGIYGEIIADDVSAETTGATRDPEPGDRGD